MTTTFIFALLIAAGLGLLMGLERTFAHKTAGLRTYALVTMASALFVLIGYEVVATYGPVVADPTRIISAIITGIGFLGAGLIIFQNNHVANLTTAAGIWVASAVGVAVGMQMYLEATVATLLVIFILRVVSYGEKYIKKSLHEPEH